MDARYLPNFIIAGAPRSATTWLYLAADRHPAISMATPVAPEPKFFLRDDLYARGLEYYSRTWFAPLPSGTLLGEKTTNYLENSAAAERIARDLPDVQLVFMLREPVERAYSNYLWSKRNGLETETFERALALEEEREASYLEKFRYARPYSYFSRGLYAKLLAPWMERFKRENILILMTDDVERDPVSVAQKLYRFLGVSPKPDTAATIGIVNPSGDGDAPPVDPAVRRALADRYRSANAALGQLLGLESAPW